MPQTDPKHRNLGFEKATNRSDCVIARRRITRPVRKEYSVWIECQHVFSRGLRRNNRQPTTAIHEHAQNIEFDTEVIGHHMELEILWCKGFEPLAQRPAAL